MRDATGDKGGRVRWGVRLVAYALCALVVATLLEVVLAVLPDFGGAQLRSLVYRVPDIPRATHDRYLALRDPVTGWPPIEAAARRFVPRPSPASAGTGPPCVTTYGDSFVFADEVGDDAAWGDVLARRLGCGVGNFGVGGFGTDQALLRFMANAGDSAPVTVLGIFAENVLRNVNQYRHFLTGAEPLGLKPRFVLDGGMLRLIEMPGASYETLVAGLRRPATLFAHDAFRPDTRHGPVIWRFPYTASLVRVLLMERVANRLRGQPSWIDFLDPEHDSRALPTTVAIADAFARAARARGKSVLVVLFPSMTGYEHGRRTGTPVYATLTAALAARGLDVLDLTADFAARLGTRSFCEILTQPVSCAGHYGAEGNEIVATAVLAGLTRSGFTVPGR